MLYRFNHLKHSSAIGAFEAANQGNKRMRVLVGVRTPRLGTCATRQIFGLYTTPNLLRLACEEVAEIPTRGRKDY